MWLPPSLSHRIHIAPHRVASLGSVNAITIPVDKCNVSQTPSCCSFGSLSPSLHLPLLLAVVVTRASSLIHSLTHSLSYSPTRSLSCTHMLSALLATKRHSAHFDICNLFSIDSRHRSAVRSDRGPTRPHLHQKCSAIFKYLIVSLQRVYQF